MDFILQQKWKSEVYNNNMTRKIRLLLAILILTASLALLVWGLWPNQEERRIVPVVLGQMQLLTLPGIILAPLIDEPIVEPQPAIPESRRLTLEFPPVMRTGDSVRIRMQLEVDDQGNITPTAVVEGNVVIGEVVTISNLYETHNVIAEARLDMAGMEVQPPGVISESLVPGQSVTFFWSVRPEESGRYEGTAWLHLRAVPKGGGEEARIPISIQFLEIEAKSFLGFLTGGTARGVGVLGSLLGSILGFPFVDDFAKWLWGRMRRR